MTMNNEGTQETPEILREEDEQFLKSLENQGFELAGREKTEPQAPEAPKVPELPKEEPKAPEPPKEEVKTETKEETTPRQPKYIEAWRHQVAEKNWEKREKALIDEINSLKNQPQLPKEEQKTEITDDNITKLAEKHQVDAELVKEIVQLASSKTQVPDDVLKTVEAYKQEQMAIQEQTQYEKDFNDNVMPLIQNEFPNATPDEIRSIKDNLKQIAYSDSYLRTPLQTIYKGVDDFRTASKTVKMTAETSRGRTISTDVDYDSVTEDDLQKMTREEQAKYFAYVDKKGFSN